jgi:uncharacterized membrane protein YkvA (DUF1232 family)
MKTLKERLKEMLSIEGAVALLGTSLGMGYFLTKLDFIPDTIAGVGYIDDALVVVAAFYLTHMAARKLLPMIGIGKKPKGKRK